jgi:hypothetical protein
MVVAVRFFSSADTRGGVESFHVVCDRKDYGLDTLSKWARKNVNRGLRNCEVKQIHFGYLAAEGFQLQMDTLKRQKRTLKVTPEWWHSLCSAAKDLPGFDAWGAFIGEKLVASVITFEMEDWAYMLYQQCLTEYLSSHANNALSFVVTKNLISRENVHQILYSVESLDAPPSVHEFQCRMGYYRKPVKQRVVFNPVVAPLVNRLSYKAVRWIMTKRPEQGFWSKVGGLMRVALKDSPDGSHA